MMREVSKVRVGKTEKTKLVRRKRNGTSSHTIIREHIGRSKHNKNLHTLRLDLLPSSPCPNGGSYRRGSNIRSYPKDSQG